MKEIKELYAKYGTLINEASNKYNLDESLVAGLVWRESRGNPEAISWCGAKGLCQLMPFTAQEMGVKNVFDPKDNLEGGCRYLRWILDDYTKGDVERTLAAYNAGIGRLKGDKWKLIRETRAYVPAVLEAAEAYRKLIASSAPTTEPVKSVEDTPKDWRTNRLRG